MNELILVLLAFILSPSLNYDNCTFREDSFEYIRYSCDGENGLIIEDSYGNIRDSRTDIFWRKDSFGNIRSSDGMIWRNDSHGNFVSNKNNRWRKDSFGNWRSNDGMICRKDSFDSLHCQRFLLPL